jgi:hypothetical protein
MKQTIEKYFTIIVFILLIFTFFKGCNDSRELTKIKNEITVLRDSMATKSEIREVNKFMIETQNTLWGFGDSYMTLLNITGESKIENKSNKAANEMLINNLKKLNSERNETLDKPKL